MYIFNVKDACFGTTDFEAEKHINVECRLHLHYSLEIVYVKDGMLKMNVSGCTRVIKKGEATLIMPFEKHSFETPEYSECYVIIFSPEIMLDFISEIKNKAISPENYVFTPDERVIEYFEKALEESFVYEEEAYVAKESQYATCDSFRAKSILYSLCWQIRDKCEFIPAAKPLHFDKAFIEAISYISNNISADLSLYSVAKVLGVHHVYLSRIFKQNCGMGFTEYVNTLRCNYSARLLRNQTLCDMTIAEIAYEAGFGSIRNFNRKFKDVYGTTPCVFRENTSPI